MLDIINFSISGTACFSKSLFGIFSFAPESPTPGVFLRYRRRGTAQQLSDGTFEFVAKPWIRPQTRLIKKLLHGRLSQTKNGDYLLTLRVSANEKYPSRVIVSEAILAADAIGKHLQNDLMEEAA